MAEKKTSQAREMALFRYTSALERGDFEVVAAVLAQAEDDPTLAQMIREVDEVNAHELEQQWETTRTPQRSAWQRFAAASRPYRIAAVVVLIAFIVIGLGTLMTSSFMMMAPSNGSIAEQPMVGATVGVQATALYMGASAEPNRPGGVSSIIEVTPVGGDDEMPLLVPPALSTPTPELGMPGTPMPSATAAAAQHSAPTLPPGTQPPGPAQGTPAPLGTQASGQQPIDRMIVKNGQIDLLVENTDTAIDQVTQIAVDNGGYMLSSQAAFEGDLKAATLTIGVRVEQYETAMLRLRQIAIKVEREISTGQDVSAEYVDLQSRVRNLEATRDRIAALMDEATTVEQAMLINRQLSEIEGQIEQAKGRMTYLAGRAAYSTITINLTQKTDATPTPTPTPTLTPTATSPWSLSPTINSATETQVSLVRSLLEVVTWLVVVPGPYVLIVGLAAWAFRTWRGRGGGKSP